MPQKYMPDASDLSRIVLFQVIAKTYIEHLNLAVLIATAHTNTYLRGSGQNISRIDKGIPHFCSTIASHTVRILWLVDPPSKKREV